MAPMSAASHHLGTGQKHACSDPTLDLLRQKLWDWHLGRKLYRLSGWVKISSVAVAGPCEPELPCTVEHAMH